MQRLKPWNRHTHTTNYFNNERICHRLRHSPMYLQQSITGISSNLTSKMSSSSHKSTHFRCSLFNYVGCWILPWFRPILAATNKPSAWFQIPNTSGQLSFQVEKFNRMPENKSDSRQSSTRHFWGGISK